MRSRKLDRRTRQQHTNTDLHPVSPAMWPRSKASPRKRPPYQKQQASVRHWEQTTVNVSLTWVSIRRHILMEHHLRPTKDSPKICSFSAARKGHESIYQLARSSMTIHPAKPWKPALTSQTSTTKPKALVYQMIWLRTSWIITRLRDVHGCPCT